MIANTQSKIQIVDTHESLGTLVNIDVAVSTTQFNRTLVTPLKELLTQLDPQQFWQVHRSTVVSVNQIVSAKHDMLGRITLMLRDRGETVSVSRTYAYLFRQM